MKAIFKYYFNPMILTVATVGYFYPLFLPLPSDGILRFLVGNVIAPLILLFVASACLAWLVAGAQVIMGIIGYRKRTPSWKHHMSSAMWAYVCYAIVIVLMYNGYILTA